MPHPHEGEGKEEYMHRCMADSEMSKYPTDQRYAICNSYWDDKAKEKHNAGAAVAATGNASFVPGMVGEDKKKEPPRLYSNMSQGDFVVEDGIPVFSETDEYGEDDLKTIVENCNKRIADTGDAPAITIGHTLEGDVLESDQPPVVGFATNFRMGTIGNINPRPAILATFNYFKDKYDEAKKYPRRSVELWTNDMVIDPISLLGASRPALPLGLYSAKNHENRKRFWSDGDTYIQHDPYEGELMASAKENLVKEIYDMLSQSEEFAYIRKCIADKHAEEDKPDTKPAEGKQDDGGGEEEEVEKKRMQMSQLHLEVEKYRKVADEATKQVADLHRKFRRAERERDLIQLEAEGYQFDRAEEMDAIQDLEPDRYTKYLDKVRKRYQRAPVGVNLNIAPVEDYGKPAKPKFGRDEMEKALKYKQQNKCSYEQAVEAVMAAN